jgi:hypothetical protein
LIRRRQNSATTNTCSCRIPSFINNKIKLANLHSLNIEYPTKMSSRTSSFWLQCIVISALSTAVKKATLHDATSYGLLSKGKAI